MTSESERVNSNKLNNMSQLAQILMAIENIEQKCFNRKYDKEYSGKSNRSAILPHQIKDATKPKNFNNFDERHAYAKKQLEVIERYA